MFDLLLPPDDVVPMAGFYDSERLGRRCLDDAITLLKVCRWWHHSAMDFRAMWAAFIPAAKHEDIWRLLVERAAGSTSLRLSYCSGIDPQLVNELLPRATAIYATDDHPWEMFNAAFAGKILPNLQILCLKPYERFMPRTVLPSHSGAPLTARRLRILETSTPLAVVASAVDDIGLHYHNAEQLATTLTQDMRPVRLVINRPREVGPLDWTALVRRVDYSHLVILKVRGLDAQSGRLNLSEDMRLDLPFLQCLDATGPISVKCPRLFLAKLFNVLVAEALFVLQETTSVAHLHLRWTPSEANFAGEPEPLHLERLTNLSIAGEISRDTLVFLNSIRAPALEEFEVFAVMDAPPDHAVLRPVKESVQSWLVVHGEDMEELLARLRQTHSDLRRAHHDDLANMLRPLIFEALVAPSLQDVRHLAQNLVSRLSDAEHAPPADHGGVLLAQIAQEMMTVASTGQTPLENCQELKVSKCFGGDNCVEFEATLPGQECVMRFILDATVVSGWGLSDAGGSLTHRVARMLFGLQPLRPRKLHFVGEPLRNQPNALGEADVEMLLEVLATYDTVAEIRLDFARDWLLPRTLCIAVADHETLPELERITVVCEPSYKNSYGLHDSDNREMSLDLWLLILDIVQQRSESGRPIATLSLEGDFCIREVHAGAAEDWVGDVDLEGVKCKNSGGSSKCRICRWRD